MRCTDCFFFERLHWHPALHPEGKREPQVAGHCALLLAALKVTNSDLVLHERLLVLDQFGCVLGIPKEITDAN